MGLTDIVNKISWKGTLTMSAIIAGAGWATDHEEFYYAAGIGVLISGAVAGYNLYKKRKKGKPVDSEHELLNGIYKVNNSPPVANSGSEEGAVGVAEGFDTAKVHIKEGYKVNDKPPEEILDDSKTKPYDVPRQYDPKPCMKKKPKSVELDDIEYTVINGEPINLDDIKWNRSLEQKKTFFFELYLETVLDKIGEPHKNYRGKISHENAEIRIMKHKKKS